MLRVNTDIMQNCVMELRYISERIRMNEDEASRVVSKLYGISDAIDECRVRVREEINRLDRESAALSNCARTLESVVERYDKCEHTCIDIGMKSRGFGIAKAIAGPKRTKWDEVLKPMPGLRPYTVPFTPIPPRGSRSYPIIQPFMITPWQMLLLRVPEGSRWFSLMPGTEVTWRIKDSIPLRQRHHKPRNPFFISPRELDDAVLKALSVK